MATLEHDVIDLVAAAGALAEGVDREGRERQKRAADLSAEIPGVVDLLVKAGRIADGERKTAAEILADPLRAVRLVGRMAGDDVATQKAASAQSLGRAVPADGGDAAPRRRRDPHHESNTNFLRALGLDPGDE